MSTGGTTAPHSEGALHHRADLGLLVALIGAFFVVVASLFLPYFHVGRGISAETVGAGGVGALEERDLGLLHPYATFGAFVAGLLAFPAALTTGLHSVIPLYGPRGKDALPWPQAIVGAVLIPLFMWHVGTIVDGADASISPALGWYVVAAGYLAILTNAALQVSRGRLLPPAA